MNVLKSSKQIMDVFEDVGRVRERLNNLSSLFAVEGKQSPTVQAFVNALMKMKKQKFNMDLTSCSKHREERA